jgi:hypothetical protein
MNNAFIVGVSLKPNLGRLWGLWDHRFQGRLGELGRLALNGIIKTFIPKLIVIDIS